MHAVIHAVTGANIDTEFRNAFPNRLGITKITG